MVLLDLLDLLDWLTNRAWLESADIVGEVASDRVGRAVEIAEVGHGFVDTEVELARVGLGSVDTAVGTVAAASSPRPSCYSSADETA